jgi:hypothetical protein
MVETAIVIYSHGHRNQTAMGWLMNDTVGKINVLGEIHVGKPLCPTQFPHGLLLDLNPGHCGEETPKPWERP